MVTILKRHSLLLGLVILGLIAGFYWYGTRYQLLPPSAYFLLEPIPEPQAGDRILVVSPHPDDETLGVGGYLHHAVAKGAVVEVVIVTDGNKHGLKTIRHQETLEAMQQLGVSPSAVLFLDFPDGQLRAHTAAFTSALTTIVDQFQPTILFSTHPADIHPDHAVVGQVIDTILAAGIGSHPTVYQYLIHYHRYPRPEGFSPKSVLLPPARLISNTTMWQKFPLTSDDEAAKQAAIYQYRSQLSRKNPLLRDLLLSFVRENEMFVIVRGPTNP